MAARASHAILLAAAAACAAPATSGPPRGAGPGASVPQVVPATVGKIVLMGVEFPDPGIIGGHFEGVQFERQVGSIQLTERARVSWSLAATQRVEERLRGAGFRVQQGALPTSDAVPVHDARFGLLGRVQNLGVNTSGVTGPRRVDASAEVAWELLDLAAGSPVYGHRVRARWATRDSVPEAVLAAVDSSLILLLADSGFRRALISPRQATLDELVGASYAPRPQPGSTEEIVLTRGDLNPLAGAPVVVQLAAAVVTLHSGASQEETAFLLTSDGLALTTHRALGGGGRRLWARFGNGVERGVRALRSDRRSGVALVQVSCPDLCTTAPWSLGGGAGRTEVVVVGAPFGASPAYLVGRGATRGRAGSPLQRRFDLNVEADLVGGEPVARVADGVVFALARPGGRHRQPALLLAEVFRVLNLRADSTLR